MYANSPVGGWADGGMEALLKRAGLFYHCDSGQLGMRCAGGKVFRSGRTMVKRGVNFLVVFYRAAALRARPPTAGRTGVPQPARGPAMNSLLPPPSQTAFPPRPRTPPSVPSTAGGRSTPTAVCSRSASPPTVALVLRGERRPPLLGRPRWAAGAMASDRQSRHPLGVQRFRPSACLRQRRPVRLRHDLGATRQLAVPQSSG
jgi:hypothetical protein